MGETNEPIEDDKKCQEKGKMIQERWEQHHLSEQKMKYLS